MTTFIFLVLGLLFVLLEFFIPGAVMGIIGGVLLLTSIVTFAQLTQSFPLTLMYLLSLGLLLYGMISYTLKKIPKAKTGFSIYLHRDQEGYQASKFDAQAIKKKGIVISDLKPGGYILVDGKKQQAISQSGYISEGKEVIVIGGEAESLIVVEANRKL
jgi:membrane-bound ClpP family serine protease